MVAVETEHSNLALVKQDSEREPSGLLLVCEVNVQGVTDWANQPPVARQLLHWWISVRASQHFQERASIVIKQDRPLKVTASHRVWLF